MSYRTPQWSPRPTVESLAYPCHQESLEPSRSWVPLPSTLDSGAVGLHLGLRPRVAGGPVTLAIRLWHRNSLTWGQSQELPELQAARTGLRDRDKKAPWGGPSPTETSHAPLPKLWSPDLTLDTVTQRGLRMTWWAVPPCLAGQQGWVLAGGCYGFEPGSKQTCVQCHPCPCPPTPTRMFVLPGAVDSPGCQPGSRLHPAQLRIRSSGGWAPQPLPSPGVPNTGQALSHQVKSCSEPSGN